MKDQYFGDINDYRKYGILRILLTESNLSLGVCWMLTDCDGSVDGEKRGYLQNTNRWRRFDPDLYDALRQWDQSGKRRTVTTIENSGLLHNSRFLSAQIVDDMVSRRTYFELASQAFDSSDLVFFDPDNGIEVASVRSGKKHSSKYVYWNELESLYSSGRSVLVYQHFPRVNRQEFTLRLVNAMAGRMKCDCIASFSTSHVLFLLAMNADHANALSQASLVVGERWRSQILAEIHTRMTSTTPKEWQIPMQSEHRF